MPKYAKDTDLNTYSFSYCKQSIDRSNYLGPTRHIRDYKAFFIKKDQLYKILFVAALLHFM